MRQVASFWNTRARIRRAPYENLYGDGFVYLSRVVYHMRNQYQFIAWGENLVFLTQMVCTVCMLHLFGYEAGLSRSWLKSRKGDWASNRASRRRAAAGIAIDAAVFAVGALALWRLVPPALLPVLSASTAPLCLWSYFTTFRGNARRRSTGRLAAPAVLLRWLGSLVRVWTTFTLLGGDRYVLANHAITCTGCSALLAQLWWYNRGSGGGGAALAQAKRSVAAVEKQKRIEQQQQRGARLASALMWRSLGGFAIDAFTEGGDEPTSEDLKASFDALDLDQTGLLSIDELESAVRRGWGANESDEVVAQMVEAADADGDGMVNFEEFVQALKGVDAEAKTD